VEKPPLADLENRTKYQKRWKATEFQKLS
jgi:hypothetical protein